jgi:hypothetical protein
VTTLHPAQRPTSGLATASLVLGIVGFIIGLCAPIGLILGLVARSKAKQGLNSYRLVTAGIIVSAISTALWIIALIWLNS